MLTPLLALTTCLLVAPAPSPTQRLTEAIDTLFLEMEHAVLAGDQRAYLALIDHDDPVFVQEQENWAKDLARGLPAAFDMVRVAEPVLAGTPDGTTDLRAMVEMRYTPGTAEGEPAQGPRVIRFRARFTSAFDHVGVDAMVAEDSRLNIGLLYAGEAWDILEHGTTRVMFPPRYRDAAQIVVDALPPIRLHVDAQMGSDNSEHIQVVKLYGDMQHLQSSIYLSYVDGLSGWNEPGEAIKIMARDSRNPRSMDGLLAHEYGHAATFGMGESANAMPWWTLEGIANYVSEAYRADYATPDANPAAPRPIPENLAAILTTWSDENRLPAWSELTDFYTVEQKWMGNVYTQGQHMIAYITDRFGVEPRNAWLRAMAQGASLDDATRSVLSVSFDELDAQWRAALSPPPPDAP